MLLGISEARSALLRVEPSVLQPQFTVYRTDDGLPSNQVRALHQDAAGMLWIGTYGGLASFDGNQFEDWRAPDDPRPLVVEAIAEDTSGRLWITSEKRGVYRLDSARRQWLHYATSVAEPQQLRSDDIWTMAPDSSGGIWLGGYGGGLHYVDREGAVHTDAQSSIPRVLSDQISALLVGPAGLWIGTGDQGLWQWPSNTAAVIACEPDSVVAVSSMRAGSTHGYATLGDGRVLALGTGCDTLQTVYEAALPEQTAVSVLPELGGISVLGLRNGVAWSEPGREAMAWLKARPGTPGTLPPGMGQALLKDREGGYWIGLYAGGLAYLPPGADQILFVPHDGGSSGGLRGRSIRGLTLAPDGSMWVGSNDFGLERVDPALSQISTWTPPSEHAVARFSVRATASWLGQLWLAHRDALWSMPMDGPRLGAIRTHAVPGIHLLLPVGDNLWAAARGDALYRLDRDGAVRSRFAPGQLAGDEVNQLVVDPDGQLWVASDGGLQRYDAEQGRLDFDSRLAHGDVASVCFDGSDLWRYSDAGLERFDRGSRQLLRRYGSAEGIPPLDTATLECRGRTLWLLTRSGFIAWSPERATTVLEWRRADGVPPVELGRATIGLTHRGRYWTAGEGGLLGLTLDLPEDDPVGFPLRLSAVRTQRGEQWIDLSGPGIVLEAQDRNLHLSARATAFRSAAATEFHYQLDGDDGSRQAFTTRTGDLDIARLAAGRYRLQVGARHPRLGTARDTPTLQIEVLPMWYQTGWARTVGIFATLLLGAAVVDTQRRRLKARHARQLAHQRLQFAERLAEEKSRFLAQSSHEMKNLLGGASGMAALIATDSAGSPASGKAQRLVDLCADLSRLLDDLLDNARLERGQISLTMAWFDPLAVLQSVLGDFATRAEQKGLSLRAELPLATQMRYGDALRLRQILANLVSNAIKYTEVGAVWLDVTLSEPERMRVRVCDSGPGISEAARAKLFEPFALGRNRRDSTGLGLWICKQLCTLCGGDIAVRSDSAGTCFDVELPWMVEDTAADLTAGPPFGIERSAAAHASGRWLIVAPTALRERWLDAARQLGQPASGVETLLAVLTDPALNGLDEVQLLLPGADDTTVQLARSMLGSRGLAVLPSAPPVEANPLDYLRERVSASSR